MSGAALLAARSEPCFFFELVLDGRPRFWLSGAGSDEDGGLRAFQLRRLLKVGTDHGDGPPFSRAARGAARARARDSCDLVVAIQRGQRRVCRGLDASRLRRIDLIVRSHTTRHGTHASSPRRRRLLLLAALELARLTKLLRVLRARRSSFKRLRLVGSALLSNAALRLSKFFAIALIMLHWTACFWAMVPQVGGGVMWCNVMSCNVM